MDDLDQKIADLEKEIKRYVAKLDAATSEKEWNRFDRLINGARETLNRYLDEKNKPFQQGMGFCPPLKLFTYIVLNPDAVDQRFIEFRYGCLL